MNRDVAIRAHLDAIDARFDVRYNDRKAVLAALRAVLDHIEAAHLRGLVSVQDTLDIIAGALGVQP